MAISSALLFFALKRGFLGVKKLVVVIKNRSLPEYFVVWRRFLGFWRCVMASAFSF
jgi:hypothetical protein